jgi:rhodanese-related sulfurtransferase
MTHADIEPGELRTRLSSGEGIYLLDVREPEEIDEWAFPGAINIPLGELGERTSELPGEGTIVVICHSGMRSAAAAEALTQSGWPAHNLVGGVVGWIESEPAGS